MPRSFRVEVIDGINDFCVNFHGLSDAPYGGSKNRLKKPVHDILTGLTKIQVWSQIFLASSLNSWIKKGDDFIEKCLDFSFILS